MANQKFTSIKNDYQLIFDSNSVIREAEDEGEIGTQGFNFVRISDLADVENFRNVDVIGVVTEMGPPNSINLKSGQVKERRNVVIADDSGCSIQVSFWSQNAALENYGKGQVIAIKGARVSDFNGKSLNSGEEHSQVIVEPNSKRVQEIQNWYKNAQSIAAMTN